MNTRIRAALETHAERIQKRCMKLRIPQRIRSKDHVEAWISAARQRPYYCVCAPRTRHRATSFRDPVSTDVVGQGSYQTVVWVVADGDARVRVCPREENRWEARAGAELEDVHDRPGHGVYLQRVEMVCDEEGRYPDGGRVQGPVGWVGVGRGDLDLLVCERMGGLYGVGEDGTGGGERDRSQAVEALKGRGQDVLWIVVHN